MSDSVQPHRRQPTRLPHPWDSPGKNTGVGCHFLPQSSDLPPILGLAPVCKLPIITKVRDFPGGPLVKNPPYDAGDMGLISDCGTKIPPALEQLSPHATAREFLH